jgi:hypothetical protein
MARIYTSQSDPLDFCNVHFPKSEEIAFKKYGNLGDGPDGRGNCFGYDADHPSYDDDPGWYRCEICKKKLTDLNG